MCEVVEICIYRYACPHCGRIFKDREQAYQCSILGPAKQKHEYRVEAGVILPMGKGGPYPATIVELIVMRDKERHVPGYKLQFNGDDGTFELSQEALKALTCKKPEDKRNSE